MLESITSAKDQIAALCQRFGVRRLELFGSATGEAFDASSSDFDFLVEFEAHSEPDLFRRYFCLKEELEKLFRREVDLVMIGALRNPHFIESVNRTRQLIYAAPVTQAA